MLAEQIVHTVRTQSATADVGKQRLALGQHRLFYPRLQHCSCVFSQRRTPLLTALTNDADMGADTYVQIFTLEACQR